MPCKSVWCGDCYLPPTHVHFFHYRATDEDGYHWGRAVDEKRHASGRDGDHLVTPFQCDLCIFRNMNNRNPGPHDQLLLECIRQANLDALWGRDSATVSSTLRGVRQTITLLRQVNTAPPYPPLGPFPVQDTLGYAVAVAMLLKSREPGRYAAYQKYETIRKLRAAYFNVYMSSAGGVSSLRSVGGERVKHQLNKCPTHSTWFERFAKGCLSRMGQIVKQDMAISLPVLHALLELLEEEWNLVESLGDRSLVASLGAFSVIAFCGSFRGPEVFLVDLYGLCKYLEDGTGTVGVECVIIPLLGRFKNEIGEQYHLTPLAA